MKTPFQSKPRWRCPHCHATSTPVACTTCNRDMCDDCISCGDYGKVCGLCKDREQGYKRWLNSGSKIDFDEWYYNNA